jgi:ABC-type nitrate/sulfonate/bicarbonate transport system substrate-binding protein
MTLEKSMVEYFRSMGSRVFVLILILSIITLTKPLARAQEQIVAGYDGHAGFQGPLWAAKDLGLFDKYGLTAELVLIPGSARGMAALLSGSVQFAQGSATAPLSAYLRGGDVVVVAAALNKFPFSVVARKEIRQPSDLIGKKIGIVNFGGSNEYSPQRSNDSCERWSAGKACGLNDRDSRRHRAVAAGDRGSFAGRVDDSRKPWRS